MCGFAGFYDLASAEAQEQRCRAMLQGVIDRGPDEEGIWSDPHTGVAFGFRRLSILDLTPAGHQPMFSHSGRSVCIFNGEIYNTRELRARLEGSGWRESGIQWRGHCDTETLLECIEAWGIEEALKSFRGMFAFALFDRENRLLTLARDRFGEKPLYWGWNGNSFLFGSELKALRLFPGFRSELDLDSISSFLNRGYVPSPQSIYRKINKLRPGCYLTMPVNGDRIIPIEQTYWSALEVARLEKKNAKAWAGEAPVDGLDQVLTQSVHRQMISDVPLGVFLSGGVDSSLLVAIMAKLSSKPIKTFTIGFKDWAFDEAPSALAVAKTLRTEHQELYLSNLDAMRIVPDLPGLSGEPFSDTSQIPTFLLCRMAKREVTVALSGDGGDEIFGGYNRYFLGVDLWDKTRRLPFWFRRGASRIGIGLSGGFSDWLIRRSMNSLPQRYKVPQINEKLQKGLKALRANTLAEVSALLLQKFDQSHLPLRFPNGKPLPWPEVNAKDGEFLPVETLMLIDTLTYLPDDILVKVDRAAMANSLETRAPYLDPEVFSYAWQLAYREKIRNGEGKVVVKSLLNRYLPKVMFDRPKSGFGIPVSSWLRGPLRGWAEDILFQSSGVFSELINRHQVQAMWKGHLSGQNSTWEPIWTLLMLGGWLEQYKKFPTPPG